MSTFALVFKTDSSLAAAAAAAAAVVAAGDSVAGPPPPTPVISASTIGATVDAIVSLAPITGSRVWL